MREWKIFAAFAGIFVVAYVLPLSSPKVTAAILEAFKMLQWYARNHTLACVVPALFIAGGIITFLSKEAVLRHLGPKANKVEAYSVASVSGTVLAVCSCSVLPMFAGIYRVGAGLGPASAFLYSGPALNILAIFLTARVLGFQIGVARAVGLAVLLMVWRWFERDEIKEWMHNTWDFAKLLVPLLFGGVFIVGFLGALLPDEQVAALVGDNSLKFNLVASVVGCLFYFATLTEIPILQALFEHGMHQGPALALLLAGPALSLPSLLVIRSVIGLKKTAVFTMLVVVMTTIVGMVYGSLVSS